MAQLVSKYKDVKFKGQPPYIKELSAQLLDKFSDLEFDEEKHKYTVKGRELTPTSDMIKNFYDEFPKNTMSIRYANSRNLDVRDVIGAWDGAGDTACTHGTKVHNYLEDYTRAIFIEENDEIRYAENKQELAGLQYISDKCLLRENFIPIVPELQMYSEKYGYAGTADLPLWDVRKGLIRISDWKTNSKPLIETAFAKPMKKPFSDLLSNSYGKYCLQLCFYQILLEDAGFKVGDREIIWLQENGQKNKTLYTSYMISDYTKRLRNWLENK